MTGDPLLTCPRCHIVPRLLLPPTQAFCGTPDCEVVMWNPTLPDGGLSTATTIDLSDVTADQ